MRKYILREYEPDDCNGLIWKILKNKTYVCSSKTLYDDNKIIKHKNIDYLEMVRQDWFNLEQVPEPERTKKIYMAAVQQNGYVLEDVKEQTPDICMTAVQKERALQFVKEQTP